MIGASQAISENGEIYVIGLEDGDEYMYTGTAIKPAFEVYDGDKVLALSTDYTVAYKNNTKVGVKTAQVTIKGKGNYTGQSKTILFTILDADAAANELGSAAIDLKGAKITSLGSANAGFTYNGEAQYPDEISVTLSKANGSKVVTFTGDGNGGYDSNDTDGLDAIVSVANNINKGTATVLITGKVNGKKNTTVKKTFKINPVDLTKIAADDLSVTLFDETLQWAVKGAQPGVEAEYKGLWMNPGQDYTVKYTDNKKVGSSAAVTITGKNNYKGTVKSVKTFTVDPLDLSSAEIVATTAYDGVKGSGVKVTILDANGDAIPASKLAVKVTKDETDMTKTKLAAGDNVTVTVTPKSAKVTEIAAESSASENVTVGANLSKIKVALPKGFAKTYTGEAVTLSDEDWNAITFSIKLSGTEYKLKEGTDFELAGYTNNFKKGTMTVTIKGAESENDPKPAFSGTKTFKVKINARAINN